jgi:endonuclease/exonuclease/phosphatase family metal-dependent hydrolase
MISQCEAMDEENKSLMIKIVSMNIAEAFASKEAPNSWTTDRENSKQIRALRLEILRKNPDFIALQEWSTKVFQPYGYTSLGTARAHAGYVDLLIRSNDQRWTVSKTVTELGSPVVCAHLTIKSQKDDLQLMVASIHLEPHLQGKLIRKRQIDRIIELSENASCSIIIVGDTNMSDDEDEYAEEKAIDLWKAAKQDEAIHLIQLTTPVPMRMDGTIATMEQACTKSKDDMIVCTGDQTLVLVWTR